MKEKLKEFNEMSKWLANHDSKEDTETYKKKMRRLIELNREILIYSFENNLDFRIKEKEENGVKYLYGTLEYKG